MYLPVLGMFSLPLKEQLWSWGVYLSSWSQICSCTCRLWLWLWTFIFYQLGITSSFFWYLGLCHPLSGNFMNWLLSYMICRAALEDCQQAPTNGQLCFLLHDLPWSQSFCTFALHLQLLFVCTQPLVGFREWFIALLSTFKVTNGLTTVMFWNFSYVMQTSLRILLYPLIACATTAILALVPLEERTAKCCLEA